LPIRNGCPVSMIHFIDDRRGIAIAGSAIMFTADGGKHWGRGSVRSSTNSDIPISHPVSIEFRGGEGWIGCDRGEILNTIDGGEHWQRIVQAGTIWAKAVGFGAWGTTYFIGHDIGFTLGGDGELFESRDRGRTWSKIATPERIVGLSCAQEQCWLVSTDKLYHIEGS
jgi:photosystem II stability/assembly factor-like uncharacterized protein